MGKRRHRIEYLPPAEADIHACAEQVCQRLAHKQGQAFADPEVVHGLAEFMRIAARIQVKHLNRSSELVDRSTDQGYFGGSDDADG
jgi:hypothetical protein